MALREWSGKLNGVTKGGKNSIVTAMPTVTAMEVCSCKTDLHNTKTEKGAFMEKREEIIRLWFAMWLKKCDFGILDIFSENAVYV